MTNPPSPNSPSGASEESLVAALAAHDIKNLLGVVIGNADIQNLWAQRQAAATAADGTEGGPIPLQQGLSDLGRSLEAIRLSAAHAMTLCEDMLAIADGRPPQMRPVALRPLVEESVEIFRGRSGGVAEVEVEGKVDLHIHGHRTDLQRTFINLMWNAFEAMDGQPDRQLAVRWGEREGAAYVEVVDNGPGLPDGHLADLTRPFHSNKSGEGKVRGLGLYSAARVMRQHGGRLLGRNRETARGAILSLQFGLERELDFGAPAQPVEQPKEMEA